MQGGVYHTGMLGKRGQHLFAGFDDRFFVLSVDGDRGCLRWYTSQADYMASRDEKGLIWTDEILDIKTHETDPEEVENGQLWVIIADATREMLHPDPAVARTWLKQFAEERVDRGYLNQRPRSMAPPNSNALWKQFAAIREEQWKNFRDNAKENPQQFGLRERAATYERNVLERRHSSTATVQDNANYVSERTRSALLERSRSSGNVHSTGSAEVDAVLLSVSSTIDMGDSRSASGQVLVEAKKPTHRMMQAMLQLATERLPAPTQQMAAGSACLPSDLNRMMSAEAINAARLCKIFGSVEGLRIEQDEFSMLMEHFVGKRDCGRLGAMCWEAADILVDHRLPSREARVLLLTLLLCTALSVQEQLMLMMAVLSSGWLCISRPQLHGLLGIICKGSPTDIWYEGGGLVNSLVHQIFCLAMPSRLGYITFAELAATDLFPTVLELINQQRLLVHQKVKCIIDGIDMPPTRNVACVNQHTVAPSNSALGSNTATAFHSGTPASSSFNQDSNLVPHDAADLADGQHGGWVPEMQLQNVQGELLDTRGELERTSRKLRTSAEQQEQVERKHTAQMAELRALVSDGDAELKKLREELRQSQAQLPTNETPDVDALAWRLSDEDL